MLGRKAMPQFNRSFVKGKQNDKSSRLNFHEVYRETKSCSVRRCDNINNSVHDSKATWDAVVKDHTTDLNNRHVCGNWIIYSSQYSED
jgi:hypothetical protein